MRIARKAAAVKVEYLQYEYEKAARIAHTAYIDYCNACDVANRASQKVRDAATYHEYQQRIDS